jgi:hypothetical protein
LLPLAPLHLAFRPEELLYLALLQQMGRQSQKAKASIRHFIGLSLPTLQFQSSQVFTEFSGFDCLAFLIRFSFLATNDPASMIDVNHSTRPSIFGWKNATKLKTWRQRPAKCCGGRPERQIAPLRPATGTGDGRKMLAT